MFGWNRRSAESSVASGHESHKVAKKAVAVLGCLAIGGGMLLTQRNSIFESEKSASDQINKGVEIIADDCFDKVGYELKRDVTIDDAEKLTNAAYQDCITEATSEAFKGAQATAGEVIINNELEIERTNG